MNLRKDRRHFQGASNADYKGLSKNELERPKTMTNVDYLSLPKMKTLNELISKREKHITNAVNPQDSTRNFYNATNKPKNDPADFDNTRRHHLEDFEKRARVFIGDSNTGLDPHSKNQMLINRFSSMKSSFIAPHQKVQTKRDVHSRAILETQQVAMPEMRKETGAEAVNLTKVLEARRAIRRKYANSKNFHKIFNLWDRESKGYISLQNIYDMLHCMGLNINRPECKVLLATSDHDGNGKMQLNEFLDLIFNDYNVLNMDLEKIPYSGAIIEEKNTQDTANYVASEAGHVAARIHKNQIRLILKNKFKQLKGHCIKEDTEKLGIINVDLFKKIMEKLEINKKQITDTDIENIFEENKYDNLNINYEKMLKELDEFSFDPEQIYSKKFKPQEQAIHYEDHLMDPRFADLVKKMAEIRNTDTFSNIESKTQPINYINKAYNTLIKTRRTLKNYFPTKQEFNEHLKTTLNHKKITREHICQDSEKQGKMYIQRNQFKEIIDEIFFNINFSLTKRELERLFVTFDYNKQGFVNADKICDIIYDETDMNYAIRLCKKSKGPPPQGDDDQEEIVLDQEEVRNKKLLLDPTHTGNRDLNQILRTVDEKVFIDNLNYFEKYNWFDKDKDRYVSMVDVKKKMSELNIINNDECEILINYLDENKKGFIKFDDFSKKCKRNMANEGPNGELINHNIMQPGMSQVKKLMKENERYRGTVKAAHDAIRPEKFQQYNINTRYGSTPGFKNTFLTFQPPKTSPMFLDEKHRLSRDVRARTAYQIEQKTKDNFYSANRENRIRSRNNFISTKIASDNKSFERKDDAKLKTKGAQQLFYEHVNHLRNPHA